MNRGRAGLRERWLAAVVVNKSVADAVKVTLFALAQHMTSSGYVSVPRERLAEMVDKHQSRVTEHIATARRAGLLDKVEGGYRGRTAEYVAVLPGKEKVTAQRLPNASERSLPSGQQLHPNDDGSAVTFSSHLSAPRDSDSDEKGDCLAVTQENARARARVTNARRQRDDHERGVAVNRTSDASERSSERQAAAHSRLVAVFPSDHRTTA